MKYLLALCLCLLPSVADAGLLFGNKTVIHNHGAPTSVQYGYSDAFPAGRTYRVYRGRTMTGYLAPAPADSVTVTKHKERHGRHGKHKTTHTETSR